MKNGIFLAAKGQVFGPFEKAAVDSMRSTGAIAQFTWIWESSSESWSPLDPAPIVNPEKNRQSVAPAAPIPAPMPVPMPAPMQAQAAPVEKSLREVSIATIVHNYKSAMSGQIVKSNDQKAILLSNDETASPQFAINSKVHLNLLDERSGRATNSKAIIKAVNRTGGRWEYSLELVV